MVLVPLFTFREAVAVVVSVSLKSIPCCLYLVAPLFPCLWNVQFNQTKWSYFWARWEHRDHSSSGLFYMANKSGRTGFSISSQWSGWVSTCEYFTICRKKRKPVIHLSLRLPIHLLYVTMANHVQTQFSSLFIRTLDVTQLSPVS